MKTKKIIIIGAGASGMVAAIESAKRGFSVTILEVNEKPGKKIYATGNGRCNITNIKMDASYFRGTDITLIESVIERFGYEDTMNYFGELGLMFKDRNGYVYPASGQAASVVNSLVMECDKLNIKILCKVEVKNVNKKNDRFYIDTDNGKFDADGVILSCGSMAGIMANKLPKASGYDFAKGFGHKIIPLVSSLTGMKCGNTSFYKETSGVRCDGNINVYSDDKLLAEDKGELQLTAYGVSGIPTFQVCRYAAYSIKNKKNTYIQIDFMPEISKEELYKQIIKRINRNERLTMPEYLNGILNDKLAVALVSQSGMDRCMKGCDILKSKGGKDKLQNLVNYIKEYNDKVTGINEFKDAQVIAGGVSLKEVDDNMQSIYSENLYMTGEMLDVDGICGGYNLQWAWATGYIAGNSICK